MTGSGRALVRLDMDERSCLDIVKERPLSREASSFVERATLERLICSTLKTVKEHDNL